MTSKPTYKALSQADKLEIMKYIMADMDEELLVMTRLALESKEAATSEESKAENKYDTRGLESSYLASGQSSRVSDLKRQKAFLETLELAKLTMQKVASGAFVETDIDGEEAKWFFIVPYRGGLKYELHGQIVHTLSPDSPLGQKMLGRRTGDVFEFRNKKVDHEFEIIRII